MKTPGRLSVNFEHVIADWDKSSTSISGTIPMLKNSSKEYFSIRNLVPLTFNIYLYKVSNRNSRKRCEICSKNTIKAPERRQWRRSGVFIVNF